MTEECKTLTSKNVPQDKPKTFLVGFGIITVLIILLLISNSLGSSIVDKDSLSGAIGKYAYNKTSGAFQGKVTEVKPCSTKPTEGCYVTDFGDTHNNYSGAIPQEHPISNVILRDEIVDPEEDLKYIYGSGYYILE